nr:reverse transcriptase domain-containing protein [Tanacetum cinerariifolium]
MTMISKDGTISKFPGYHSSEEEEPTRQSRALNKYGFVDHPELQRNEFASHRQLQQKGNMNGWLIEDEDEPLEHEASDKEVDSDLESTASSKPMMKKTTKANPDRAFHNCPYCSNGPNNNNNNNENPDIATIIAQQLQTILPYIVTQVTNNVNNANGRKGGNGGNGGNNGCTYKGFMACNPKEYDGKGDRFHELAKLVPHLVTPELSCIKRAGILTDEAVSYGIPAKGNEKRKGVEESSKQGGGRNENKRAKTILASLRALDDMDISQPASLPELSLCETPLVVAAAIPTSPSEIPQRNLVLWKYYLILGVS